MDESVVHDFTPFGHERLLRPERERFTFTTGTVTNNNDPERLGRVKVKLHYLSEDYETDWIRIATLCAGDGSGSYFVPEVGDEVLVGFLHTERQTPYVLGCLWNGERKPPEVKGNGVRILRSKSGHSLIMDDTEGGEVLSIVSCDGKSIVSLDVKNKLLRIENQSGDIKISAPEGTLKIDCRQLEIHCDEKLFADAKESIELRSKGSMTLQSTSTLSLKGRRIELN